MKTIAFLGLEDEMIDAAISWCDSNGVNSIEPEQLLGLVKILYITVQDAAVTDDQE